MTISAYMAQQRAAYFNQSTNLASNAPESLGKIGGEAPAQQEASLSFGDVLDAINPLNHIPVVSDLVSSSEADAKPSPLSGIARLAGGALLGGPIGFLVSLAGTVFEGATGQSPVQAVASLFTPDAPTAVASNATAVEAQQHAEAAPVDTVDQVAQNAAMSNDKSMAALAPGAAKPAPVSLASGTQGKTILDLYGTSTPSAHASYRQAQLRPYLQDVTVSKVL